MLQKRLLLNRYRKRGGLIKCALRGPHRYYPAARHRKPVCCRVNPQCAHVSRHFVSAHVHFRHRQADFHVGPRDRSSVSARNHHPELCRVKLTKRSRIDRRSHLPACADERLSVGYLPRTAAADTCQTCQCKKQPALQPVFHFDGGRRRCAGGRVWICSSGVGAAAAELAGPLLGQLSQPPDDFLGLLPNAAIWPQIRRPTPSPAAATIVSAVTCCQSMCIVFF